MVVGIQKGHTYRVRVRNRTHSQGRALTNKEKTINGLEFYVKCMGFLGTTEDESQPSQAAFDVIYYDPNFRLFAASGVIWLLMEDVDVLKEIGPDE